MPTKKARNKKTLVKVFGATTLVAGLIVGSIAGANAVEANQQATIAAEATATINSKAADQQLELNKVAMKAKADTNDTVSGKFSSQKMTEAHTALSKTIEEATRTKPLYSADNEISFAASLPLDLTVATDKIEQRYTELTATIKKQTATWVEAFNTEKARVAKVEKEAAEKKAAEEAAAKAATEAQAAAEAEAAAQAQAQVEAEAAQAAQQAAAYQPAPQAPAPQQGGQRAPQAPAQAAPPAAPAGPVVNFTLNTAGAGAQGLIDACVGAVDVTNTMYGGIPALAQHWHCGGYAFPTWAGAVVQINGYGLYRVNGIAAVLNHATNTTADLPRGHELLYQTCLNNNSATMALVSLSRIG